MAQFKVEKLTGGEPVVIVAEKVMEKEGRMIFLNADGNMVASFVNINFHQLEEGE